MGPQQFTVSESVVKKMSKNYEEIKNGTTLKILNANVLLNVQKATRVLQSSNVLGILPGTDLKDEYLFITAHYDHLGKRDTVIYYGADDDGSGTVAVVEMAEAFAKAKADGKGPRRSIVFMTVSGEEKGLWGSEFYSNNPVYPLSKTTADLNIDMIGRSDSSRKGDTLNYVYVVGDDKLSSDLKVINESQNKKYTKLTLDYKFNDPKDPHNIYYRSDHYSFAKYGVPIIFYYDGMLGADYHRPTDTPDKINYPLLMKRAQLVFYTAWEMANRNDMLKRDLELPVLRR
jgi:Zn-dependent M28 family amino/carboxypeptidase